MFAALLEFASINFITLFIKRYKAVEEKKKEAEAKAVEEAERLAKEAEELQLPKVLENEQVRVWIFSLLVINLSGEREQKRNCDLVRPDGDKGSDR